jgi:hypothetical protein
MALEAAHARGLGPEVLDDGGWETLGLSRPAPAEEADDAL